MSREAQTRPLVGGTGLDHSVAGLRGAAGLGNNECQGLPQLACQGAEDLVHAIGIGVVEEIGCQLVGMRMPQGLGHKLGTECRSPNPDDQHVLERP